MTKKLKFCLIIFFVIFFSIGESIAQFDLAGMSGQIREENLAEKKLSRAMVQLVRNEYRMAIQITERLLACFTNDRAWFSRNSSDIRDRYDFCPIRIEQIRNDVKEKLPLMRIYLALSMKSEPLRVVGGLTAPEDPNLYQFPTDQSAEYILDEMYPEANNIVYPFIRHTFPTVELSPLNLSEIRRAIEILNNDLAWVRHKYGDEEPSLPPVCFNENKFFPPSRRLTPERIGRMSPERALVVTGDGISTGERECYYDLYMATIFGGQVSAQPWTEGVQGFPLLAYIADDNGSDESIIEALRKRLELTKNAKEDFESRYYINTVTSVQVETPSGVVWQEQEVFAPHPDLTFSSGVMELLIYDGLIDSLLEANPEFAPTVERGREIKRNRELRRSLVTVGAIFASIPICSNLFVGALARGLCMLPFGLGLNGYMVYESEIRLRRAVDDMLMSPNGLRVLNHIDSLTDYQFSRNMEWMLLPIGTGLVNIGRDFRAFQRAR